MSFSVLTCIYIHYMQPSYFNTERAMSFLTSFGSLSLRGGQKNNQKKQLEKL